MSVDKPLPDDIIRAHRIRDEIGTHLSKSSMLISLLEFIENFGANTLELYDMLEEVDGLEKVAEEHYLMDEYDRASDVFEEVHAAWNSINVRAARVKSNALIWVYAIEWMAILGTSLLAGTFLWMVMTRGRFYREVKSTRTSMK